MRHDAVIFLEPHFRLLHDLTIRIKLLCSHICSVLVFNVYKFNISKFPKGLLTKIYFNFNSNSENYLFICLYINLLLTLLSGFDSLSESFETIGRKFIFIKSACEMIPTQERRAMILQLIQQNNRVSIGELQEKFGISEVSLRKDLNIMHNARLLIRTRGGAMKIPDTNRGYDIPISSKKYDNVREKEGIGKLAASLINDGETILLDSGTTTLEIARNLHRFSNLTIVTNAVNIAIELLKYERFMVILLGGHIRETSLSTVGPTAEASLKSFFCDKLFLGVDSFSISNGISTPNLEEANLNQTMISMSKEVIAVFDYSKCQKRSFAHICRLEDIDAIISDKKFPARLRPDVKKAGVRLYIANLDD